MVRFQPESTTMAIHNVLVTILEPEYIEKLENKRASINVMKEEFFRPILTNFMTKNKLKNYQESYGNYDRLYLNMYKVHVDNKNYK